MERQESECVTDMKDIYRNMIMLVPEKKIKAGIKSYVYKEVVSGVRLPASNIQNQVFVNLMQIIGEEGEE